MSGSAASKKQPTFEQFSPANIFTLHWPNDPLGWEALDIPAVQYRNLRSLAEMLVGYERDVCVASQTQWTTNADRLAAPAA